MCPVTKVVAITHRARTVPEGNTALEVPVKVGCLVVGDKAMAMNLSPKSPRREKLSYGRERMMAKSAPTLISVRVTSHGLESSLHRLDLIANSMAGPLTAIKRPENAR